MTARLYTRLRVSHETQATVRLRLTEAILRKEPGATVAVAIERAKALAERLLGPAAPSDS